MMKRVAAPMVGGLATSFVMELLVYPAIYLLWKWNTEVKRGFRGPGFVASDEASPEHVSVLPVV